MAGLDHERHRTSRHFLFRPRGSVRGESSRMYATRGGSTATSTTTPPSMRTSQPVFLALITRARVSAYAGVSFPFTRR